MKISFQEPLLIPFTLSVSLYFSLGVCILRVDFLFAAPALLRQEHRTFEAQLLKNITFQSTAESKFGLTKHCNTKVDLQQTISWTVVLKVYS